MKAEEKDKENAGQKFYINIEGTEYFWETETITTGQIRQLGSLPADQPVVVEDPDGGEQTLPETGTITIKPGHRLGRAPKYKRG